MQTDTAPFLLHPKPNPDAQRLQWLQALRGLAALMVLFFHMSPYWDWHPHLRTTTAWMRWGFSGVDIFFVLSGFVVYRSASQMFQKQGLWHFFRQRATRIYLTYWSVFLPFALISTLYLNAPPRDATHFWRSFFLLYPDMYKHWMAIAWSLSYELYFYVLTGLLFLLPPRFRTLSFAALFGGILVWHGGWLLTEPSRVVLGTVPLKFSLNAFTLEFLSGVLLSIVYNRVTQTDLMHPRFSPYRIAACLLGLMLLVAGYHIGRQGDIFNRVEIWRVASYGVAALGAVVLVLLLEHSPYQPHRLFVKLGDASYCIYLLHPLGIGLIGKLLHRWFPFHSVAMLIGLLCMPVIVVFFSGLWHEWIERRLIKLSKR